MTAAYAAVAAKISDREAFIIRPSAKANKVVKHAINASTACASLTEKNVKIAPYRRGAEMKMLNPADAEHSQGRDHTVVAKKAPANHASSLLYLASELDCVMVTLRRIISSESRFVESEYLGSGSICTKRC